MILFVFLAGLAIGSFLNAYIFRLAHNANDHEARNEGPRKVSVWRGRSYCPKCKKALRWYELIPLVSFAVQFGRCRGCKQKIDWQYPAVELATGLLFVLGLQIVNNQFTGYGLRVTGYVTTGYLLSVLVILFVYDLRYGLVPDRVVLPAIAVAFLYSIVSVSRESENGLLLTTYYLLLSVLAGAAFFAAQYYFSRGRWLGSGDIRIGALMGAMLGWPYIILGIVLSYFIGGAVGLALLLTRQKKFGQTLPLGTFLTLGTVIVFLYGEQIWNWYWR